MPKLSSKSVSRLTRDYLPEDDLDAQPAGRGVDAKPVPHQVEISRVAGYRVFARKTKAGVEVHVEKDGRRAVLDEEGVVENRLDIGDADLMDVVDLARQKRLADTAEGAEL